ncbi:MAG: cation:proton antiporter subunit C [Clostridia bacterium]
MINVDFIIDNINYIGAFSLFVIGLYTVLTHSNLLKRIIGVNIMETSVFLFFVSIGFIRGAKAPIIEKMTGESFYVNPLPSAMILTGIVVAVSITAYALSLLINLYKEYGTLEIDEILIKEDRIDE